MATKAELEAQIAELEAAQARTEMLNQISRALNAARDEVELLSSLTPPTLQVETFMRNLIYIELDEAGEPEWAEVVSTWLRDGSETARGAASAVGRRFYLPEFPFSYLWLADPTRPLCIADTATDERLDERTREAMLQLGTCASVFIPLTLGSRRRASSAKRRWVGLVTLDWDEPREFSEQELQVYSALVDLVAPIVVSWRLLVEKERAVVETLYQISRDLNMAKDKDELLHILAQPAIKAGATRVGLLHIDLDQDGRPEWAETVAVWQKDSATPPGMRYHLSDFLYTDVFVDNANKPLLVTDVATDERMDENVRNVVSGIGYRALVIVPLTQVGLRRERSVERLGREASAERRWVGLLIFLWDEPHEFSPQETEIYQALVGLASPAVDSRRLVGQLEVMVQERTAELEQSRQMLYQILDTIPVRVFWKDRDCVYLGCNRLFAQDAGLESAQEIVGKSDFDLGWAEQAELYRTDDQRVMDAGKPKLNYEEPQTTPDGSKIWLRTSKVPLRDAEGHVSGLLGTYDDVSDIKRAEAERGRLQQQVIEAQQQAIQELSTPVIPIMDRILVLPLVGSIDSMRARHIMRALLEGIRAHRARVVILDITGVPIIDSGVAAHLDKTIQAARLKGAKTIITGLSDAVAESIVDLGIDWSKLDTLSDLRTGLIVALDSLGIKLSKT